jgi:hypothetical protein
MPSPMIHDAARVFSDRSIKLDPVSPSPDERGSLRRHESRQ